MSTRSKYLRVKPVEENNENKLDTDIIMRFSPTYGTIFINLYRKVHHQGSHSFLWLG